MAKIYDSITQLVGHTPIVEFHRLKAALGLKGRIAGKLEYFNHAGSHKDRIALEIIEEAEKRGIKHHDIVKIYNERGIVLCAAYVTERLMPQVVYVDHGARLDPIIPGWLDRGGAINTITPTAPTSRNATGMAVSGFLTQVEKVSDEEWRSWKQEYPEAFARKGDDACGVCLEGWLVSEKTGA